MWYGALVALSFRRELWRESFGVGKRLGAEETVGGIHCDIHSAGNKVQRSSCLRMMVAGDGRGRVFLRLGRDYYYYGGEGKEVFWDGGCVRVEQGRQYQSKLFFAWAYTSTMLMMMMMMNGNSFNFFCYLTVLMIIYCLLVCSMK